MQERKDLISLLGLAFSFSLFLFAYFPPSNSVTNDIEDVPVPPNWERRVGQLVIVVIDALRADFVFNIDDPHRDKGLPKIPYVKNKLQDSDAFGCILRCSPPTVTLPRIKSILTGRKPTYLDVINNINSDKLLEDSLLLQWNQTGLKMTMFGDETWERISPVKFLRSDPTTSFFVSDYTEVDHNVTRHLDAELQADDWDVMILHYLGLDHIGHLEGPDSKLIAPKLEEMSQVIQNIYSTLSNKHFKLDLAPAVVIVGDHGMADGGGHGGATQQEVLVPLVVLSPFIQNKKEDIDSSILKEYFQIDLAPSLSFLLGNKIPRLSNGKIIEELFEAISSKAKQDSQLYNSNQLSALLSQESKANDIQQEALNKIKLKSDDTEISLMLKSCIGVAQEELLNSGLHYDMYLLTCSIIMIFTTIGLRSSVSISRSTFLLGAILLESVHFLICSSTESSLCTNHSYFLIVNFYLITSVTGVLSIKVKDVLINEMLPIYLTLAHTLSLLSSSFVEEEHQTFYFIYMTILSVLIIKHLARKQWGLVARYAGCAALHRFLRAMNQTGDKWKHLPDISDVINQNENIKVYLFVSSMMITTLLFNHKMFNLIGNCIISIIIIVQKTTQSVILAQLLYFLIFIKFVSNRKDNIFESSVFLCCVLHSETNVIVIVCFIVMLKILDNQNPVIYYILAKCLHFYLGNSNSLASIQVGAGYTGLSEYRAVPVILLLAVHTYSGLILTYLYALQKGCKSVLTCHFYFSLCDMLVFCILSVVMRYHIFVWSVFSPKLLYFGMELVVFTAFSSIYYLFVK